MKSQPENNKLKKEFFTYYKNKNLKQGKDKPKKTYEKNSKN